MNQDEPVKAMELDQLVGAPRLNMLKAALPYIPSDGQMLLSILIKAGELKNTMSLCAQSAEEGLGICSLGKENSTPLDMLHAIKPFSTQAEQEFIDIVENFIEGSRLSKAYQETTSAQSLNGDSNHRMSMIDMMKMMMPPQQAEKLEMYQMLMQVFQQSN